MLGHMGTSPRHAGLCRAAQEAPGTGWLVSTYMLLHCRSWVDFPRGLDKGGTAGRRWQEEKEALRTGDRAGSCPQKTEAVMPVSEACWRMSYLLFQELTVISTVDLTKVDQSLPAQPWLLALQLTQLMSVWSRYATKTQWHRAANAIKRVLQVLKWETTAPSPCP